MNDEQVEKEQLEREQNERHALDDDYVSPGMSVEVVAVVVNIKTLKMRLIDHDRVVRGRGEESRNEEEICMSVCSQV